MPDSSLCEVDKRFVSSCIFINNVSGDKVDFQFPPKIINDSNSIVLNEQNAKSFEPQRVHMGASGRRIQMEWEYISTASNYNGKTISQNLRNLKKYFFDFTDTIVPLVTVSYPPILPISIDFYLLDVNITHSPELVSTPGGVYPLHTKVSVNLSMATKNRARNVGAPLREPTTEWY